MLTIINGNAKIIAYLNNVESGNIKESINGEYTLDFICDIEPLKTEYLYDDANLLVYENDYFRVVEIEELHNEEDIVTVSVLAEHISYDLIKNEMVDFNYTNKTAAEVMLRCLDGTGFSLTNTDITLKTDIQYTQTCNSKQISIAIANNWIGELSYFRKTIQLLKRRGENRNVDFRFGKNLRSIKRIRNFAEKTISYEVDVLDSEVTRELGYFTIGDTIKVIDDRLNIELETRIVELERDIVTGLNSTVVLGEKIKDLRSSFSNIEKSLSKVTDDVNNVVDGAIGDINNSLGQLEGSVEAAKQYAKEEADKAYNKAVESGESATDAYAKAQEAYLEALKGIDEAQKAIETATDAKTYAEQESKKAYDKAIESGLAADEAAKKAKEAYDKGLEAYEVANSVKDVVDKNKGYWDRIKDITTDLGNVIAGKLDGIINTANASISSTAGHVTWSGNTILIHDQPSEANSNWCMELGAAGLRIANSRVNNKWNWRTAVTGEGVKADTVAAGAIDGLTINSVILKSTSIVGGDITGVIIKGSKVVGGDESGVYTLIDANNPLAVMRPTGKVAEMWGGTDGSSYLTLFDRIGLEKYSVRSGANQTSTTFIKDTGTLETNVDGSIDFIGHTGFKVYAWNRTDPYFEIYRGYMNVGHPSAETWIDGSTVYINSKVAGYSFSESDVRMMELEHENRQLALKQSELEVTLMERGVL